MTTGVVIWIWPIRNVGVVLQAGVRPRLGEKKASKYAPDRKPVCLSPMRGNKYFKTHGFFHLGYDQNMAYLGVSQVTNMRGRVVFGITRNRTGETWARMHTLGTSAVIQMPLLWNMRPKPKVNKPVSVCFPVS